MKSMVWLIVALGLALAAADGEEGEKE